MRPSAAALLVVLVGGCEEESPPAAGDTADTEVASTGEGSDTVTDTDTDTEGDVLVCDEAPTLTYDTFGKGFLASYCNGCHGGQVANRQGAPETIVFDTREQAEALGERILARALRGEGATPMPPAGGITQADVDRLEIWLTCFP